MREISLDNVASGIRSVQRLTAIVTLPIVLGIVAQPLIFYYIAHGQFTSLLVLWGMVSLLLSPLACAAQYLAALRLPTRQTITMVVFISWFMVAVASGVIFHHLPSSTAVDWPPVVASATLMLLWAFFVILFGLRALRSLDTRIPGLNESAFEFLRKVALAKRRQRPLLITQHIADWRRSPLGAAFMWTGVICLVTSMGSMLAIFVTGGKSDRVLSLEDVTLLMLGGLLLAYLSTYLLRPSATSALRADHRAPVILLRSFADDGWTIDAESPAILRAMAWLHGLIDRTADYSNDFHPILVENVIGKHVTHIGPFIALGDPIKNTPSGRFIAARDYASHQEWQITVGDWLDRASLVFIIWGAASTTQLTNGLTWELTELMRKELLKKTVVFRTAAVGAQNWRPAWDRWWSIYSHKTWHPKTVSELSSNDVLGWFFDKEEPVFVRCASVGAGKQKIPRALHEFTALVLIESALASSLPASKASPSSWL